MLLSRGRGLVRALPIVAVVMLLFACSGAGDDTISAGGGSATTSKGSALAWDNHGIGSVQLGDSKSDVLERLGRVANGSMPGPNDGCLEGVSSVQVSDFLLQFRDDRLIGFLVTGPTKSKWGFGIGDSLGDVMKVLPDVRTADTGQGHTGWYLPDRAESTFYNSGVSGGLSGKDPAAKLKSVVAVRSSDFPTDYCPR